MTDTRSVSEKKNDVLYDESGADVCYLMDNLAEQDLYIEDKTPDSQFGYDYYTDISEDICNFINENYRGLLNGKEKVNDDYERDE